MPRDRDDDSGRYTETFADETFLTAISTADPPTTANVAEEVGCSYDLAYRRLNSLVEENRVAKTDIGGSFLWSRSDADSN